MGRRPWRPFFLLFGAELYDAGDLEACVVFGFEPCYGFFFGFCDIFCGEDYCAASQFAVFVHVLVIYLVIHVAVS